ncbi:MAG: large conductance mechanosensitive channel protein MscL [Candidatus Saccharibacteria bacterium]|nr:large conductance mechanosensitive channel protein MscL [Moraxellaceae bacterium]
MSIVQEFKTFAIKGNMIDLAVGVIIGAAFGKIIDSLVNDLIMPIISFILGGKVDFSKLFFILGDNPLNLSTLDALKKADIAVLAYGNFITIMINFILLAIVVFMMVKAVNKMKKNEPAAAPAATPEDVGLLREIRDELRRRP